jgi:hypothetical protein
MDVGQRGRRGSTRAILSIVLLALVLAGCASKQPQKQKQAAAVRSDGTASQVFHAYGADGDLAVKVGDVASGNCWTSSVAAPVAGSYRCFAGNKILDPCFAPAGQAHPTQVACVDAPWSDAIVLTLTSALPTAEASPAVARPWAFQLANGARCVASTGTVPAIQGVNLGYHCSDGHDAGLPDTSVTPATVDYGDEAAQTVQSVTVTTIWRG